MSWKSLFSATLGLSSPWKITSVTFSDGENRVDIAIDFDNGTPFVCAACGAPAVVCAAETAIWQRHDFFRRTAYFHVRAPSLSCREGCGVTSAEGPWTKGGANFTPLEMNTGGGFR